MANGTQGNFGWIQRQGLVLKLLVPMIFILVLAVGVGMTVLVLQQGRQPYRQEIARLRAIAVQMDNARDYTASIQPVLAGDAGQQYAHLETVPIVSALRIGELYSQKEGRQVTVRVTTDRPRNPRHQADEWERAQIECFRANPTLSDYTEETSLGGQTVLRYAMPVQATGQIVQLGETIRRPNQK